MQFLSALRCIVYDLPVANVKMALAAKCAD